MESAYFLFLQMVLLINVRMSSRHFSLIFTMCVMEGWKAPKPRSLGGGTSGSTSENSKCSNEADCRASQGKREEGLHLIEVVVLANLIVMLLLFPQFSWTLLRDGWSLTVRF